MLFRSHGTVTVIADGVPVEITTFRTDGEYLDSRHPESVSFSKNIEDDLARRDFTVNSVAMNLRGEVVDPFGGREDMARGIIRCTGDPDTRFSEDALRIIRALRFSSVLGFEIERRTAESVCRNRERLERIAAERIFSELKKLLCGKDVFRVLSDFYDVICVVIPELRPSVGFDQKNRYHIYDVYTHSAKTVEAAEPDEILRLAALLHDAGKPHSYTEENGAGHFYGHAGKSAEIASEWLERMHADNETIRLVTLLCANHDKMIYPVKKSVKRLFLKFTYDEIIMLCKLQKADTAAHAPECQSRLETSDRIMELAREIKRENECVSLKDLEIGGDDLISLGYRGREIGDKLREVLSLVVDETLPNRREDLIEYLKK